MKDSKTTIQTKNSEPSQTHAPLFRAQALAHKRRSLYGEVVLVANPALWLISASLILATCALLGFVFLAPLFGAPNIDNTVGQTFWQWLTQEPG